MAKPAIPESVRFRLHEYSGMPIDLEAFKWVIIERILEHGAREEVRWLFSVYPRNDIIESIAKRGPRHLSRKNLVFWSRFFNLPIPEKRNFPLWPA